MDILSNKAVLIGFGVLISIIVMTGVLFSINQIKEIYGYVDETDISVVKEFEDIFTEYNGAEMNGVDLVNTIKRFEGNTLVSVTYIGQGEINVTRGTTREAVYVNNIMKEGKSSSFRYEKKYNIIVKYLDNNQNMQITFVEKGV